MLIFHSWGASIREQRSRKVLFEQSEGKTTQRGLHYGWAGVTFVLRKDYLKKLKAVSYGDRKKLKEVVDEALGDYLKGKRIKSMSNGRRIK